MRERIDRSSVANLDQEVLRSSASASLQRRRRVTAAAELRGTRKQRTREEILVAKHGADTLRMLSKSSRDKKGRSESDRRMGGEKGKRIQEAGDRSQGRRW